MQGVRFYGTDVITRSGLTALHDLARTIFKNSKRIFIERRELVHTSLKHPAVLTISILLNFNNLKVTRKNRGQSNRCKTPSLHWNTLEKSPAHFFRFCYVSR